MPESALPTRRLVLGGMLGAGFTAAVGAPAAAVATEHRGRRLWSTASRRGLAYGSSAATWQLADADYAELFRQQAAVLLTEDDLLWYRLRPSPRSGLHFEHADKIIEQAAHWNQYVVGAHLVWDQGFGRGWRGDRLWTLPTSRAHELLYGTIRHTLTRYRGRVGAWSVANEVIAHTASHGHRGLRTNTPWFATCGPDYVAHAFHVARAADPSAVLILNDFGFETVDPAGHRPEHKQRAALHVLDRLLDDGVPVDAFGLQAHLYAHRFAERFDARRYRTFIAELAARGLTLLVTELDVCDDGVPGDRARRDRAVADVYRRYLDCILDQPAVAAVLTFGLSDRYSWLVEQRSQRRPLPYDSRLRAKPAHGALLHALHDAPRRHAVLSLPRARRT